MAKAKVLVVDDEARIVEVLRLYLERDDYAVVAATDGEAALRLFQREQPDLVILDLRLPGRDGLDVCREIRRQSATPIIMVTARDEDADKLIGLELGADDYVTKPFSPREVVARVRAVLRRTLAGSATATERIAIGPLALDLGRHEARCDDRALALSPTEFRLLVALAREPGRVLSRLQLLDQAQGEAYDGYERTIDTHIKNLRQKLGDASCRIATVRGFGYKLETIPDA